jgi:PAS domain S-box-containing protein
MTLRAKASLLIAVILTGALGITGVFHLGFFEDSLRRSVLDGLDSIGTTTAQTISRFLFDTLGEVDAIAISLPGEALRRKDTALVEEKLKAFAERFPKFENGLFLLDREGRLWVDYPAHAEQRGKSFAFREYFRRTMEEKRGVIGMPYLSARTGKPVLTFTAPLHDPSGRITGLLGCSVQLTSPSALEGIRLTRIGKTGYLYVYSRDRLMILHPESERVMKRDVQPGANRLFDEAINGFEGAGETVNSRGVPMLASFRRIPGTDWILGAQQPRAEAFAPVHEAQGRVVASILLGIISAVVIAAISITGFTRPLLKLRRAVLLFGAAEQNRLQSRNQEREYLKELEGIDPRGEIGDLTRAFLGISEQLDLTMRFLKESARDWERTFDSVSEVIVILDGNGRIIRMNLAAKTMLETEYSEGIGRSILDLLKGVKILAGSPENGNADARESGFHVEIDRPGRHHILEVTLTPLLERAEQNAGTVVVAKDITSRVQGREERRRLEVQLQQAQKMEAIGTLAGGIAHNFNNLLMGIQGNASLLLLDVPPDQASYQRAKNIEKLVQSGARLTTQLLGYAREGKFQSRALSLNHLIRETSETFAMARKDIRVVLDLRDDLCSVVADQGQLEQVLMNLLVNAADAMPKGGTLSLSTENCTRKDRSGNAHALKPGEYVLLCVKDTGTGMDSKTLERIFDPFFTTKAVGKGTGLGLASVYGIVKGHGGHIEVESEVGRGATFRIYLPACGEAPTAPGGSDRSPRMTRGHERVLLVDDEEMVLDIGQKILTRMGYRVFTARGAREALEIYSRESDSIDLVLLDMIMPDLCGGETFDHMRRINPEVKVLLSSGYSIDGQAGEILKRGCRGFIQKPFNIEQLSQKIRDVLGSSQTGCLS